MFGTATKAEDAATGAGSASEDTANQISSASNGWVNAVSSALGGVAGNFATGGMTKLFKGAIPKAPSVSSLPGTDLSKYSFPQVSPSPSNG